jgi:bifunctional N-acetylglucosamine-1-phosphate-uridyltransferase/glucosamine-1-phosphate-acetyltransferase GlmU-like protein
MEVIVPAAGLSTRFPNMPPKYMLEDVNGKSMLENALAPYIGKCPIRVIILMEHDLDYEVTHKLFSKLGPDIEFGVLWNQTKGPADTVKQYLQTSKLKGPILIKDCDSYFDHQPIDDNYLCVKKMVNIDRQLANKSFAVMEDDKVRTVVEKSIASRYYNVGGYKFNSVEQYLDAYNNMDCDGEQFISSVVNKSIEQGHVFKIVEVSDYVDVGTIDEWTKRSS